MRCIRPRYADGRWLENFSAETGYPDTSTGEWWDVPFYEGTALQYTTFVPHDVHGLIERFGGERRSRAGLTVSLTASSTTPPTSRIYWLPICTFMPAGRTGPRDRVRTLLETQYREGRGGLPGNDDSGTMSSWYVWGAIGISRTLGRLFITLEAPCSGTLWSISAKGEASSSMRRSYAANRYVQSAELNGKPLHRAWLFHSEIASGGRLVLHLGPVSFRLGAADRPPWLRAPNCCLSH